NYPSIIYPVVGNLGEIAKWGTIRNPSLKIMDKEILQRLHQEGVSIGGHSVTHCKLDELDEANLFYEVNDCKTQLESIINDRIVSFSYPHDRFNSKVID